MDIDKIVDMIVESDNIVFFGGAGVSTESGVPDFRSATGLYNQQNDSGYSPEYMLSHDFLIDDNEGFSNYYKENLILPEVKPNITHHVLAELERRGKLKAIVTQNIDGLHQMAGSKNVLEIHGNLRDHYCMSCGKRYPQEEILTKKGAVYCDCGGFIRPDVVLYGEMLPEHVVGQAVEAIAQADVLIIAGTSLVVYPAASFIRYYRGHKSIMINKEVTGGDRFANYVIHDSLGKVFDKIDERLG